MVLVWDRQALRAIKLDHAYDDYCQKHLKHVSIIRGMRCNSGMRRALRLLRLRRRIDSRDTHRQDGFRLESKIIRDGKLNVQGHSGTCMWETNVHTSQTLGQRSRESASHTWTSLANAQNAAAKYCLFRPALLRGLPAFSLHSLTATPPYLISLPM